MGMDIKRVDNLDSTKSGLTPPATVFLRGDETVDAGTRTKMQVTDLSVYYGKFQALAGITMAIPANRITAIIGPSGCGKSTLLRSLNRMNDLVPRIRIEGAVDLDGTNIYDPAVDVVDVRRRVGMVFQRPNPFPKSIYENVTYGPKLYGIHRRSDLDEIVERSSNRRSCGMR